MILIPTTTTEQYRPLSNAERIEVWRLNSTCHDADVGAQAHPLPSVPGTVRQPGLILTHDQIALYMAAFGRVPQDEGEQYAADECLEGRQRT